MNRNDNKPSEKKNSVVAFLALLFFGVLIILFVVFTADDIWTYYVFSRTVVLSKTWPETTAEVTSAIIHESYDGQQISFIPKITYRYNLSGTQYFCDIISKSFSSKEDAEKVLRSFLWYKYQVSYN
jgi:hypothetical protein